MEKEREANKAEDVWGEAPWQHLELHSFTQEDKVGSGKLGSCRSGPDFTGTVVALPLPPASLPQEFI